MHEILRREITGRTAVASVTERSDGDVHPERVRAETLRRRQVELTGSAMGDGRRGPRNRCRARRRPGIRVGPHSPPWVTCCWPSVRTCRSPSGQPTVRLWPCSVRTEPLGWSLMPDGAAWPGECSMWRSTRSSRPVRPLQQRYWGHVIHGCCNEFGLDDLERVAGGVGAERRSTSHRPPPGARTDSTFPQPSPRVWPGVGSPSTAPGRAPVAITDSVRIAAGSNRSATPWSPGSRRRREHRRRRCIELLRSELASMRSSGRGRTTSRWWA